jgi:DNA-binding GntR family transcriptional regulator
MLSRISESVGLTAAIVESIVDNYVDKERLVTTVAVRDPAIGDRNAGRAGNALYAQLSGRIVRGELAPGVHLVEQQLAAELGTGRTPLRAVLQRLVQDGLAIAGGESRSKVLIAPMSSTELLELAAILGALDGLASATVATRTASQRPPIVSRLRANHGLFARATRAGTDAREELFDLHRTFHGMIVDDAQLHVVANVRAPVALRMQRYEWVHGGAPPADMAASVAEHDAVIDAIADGDGERAELAMRTNWNNAARRLRALLPFATSLRSETTMANQLSSVSGMGIR